jgi:precorrin-2/cobalt-factor-2 C20-methyltransferase
LEGAKYKELLDITFPMTRDEGELKSARDEAAGRIAQKLSQGNDVAFITLGDPMFYSTFSYIMAYVKRKCPKADITVVPGVNAPGAASAALQSALCEGDDKVAIIPAVYDPAKVRDVLLSFDTVVLMKVNKVIDRVIDLLEDTGLISKAVLISKVSWADEVIVTDVATLRGVEKPPYFSMVIVRK